LLKLFKQPDQFQMIRSFWANFKLRFVEQAALTFLGVF
jgi:hypothetical protein